MTRKEAHDKMLAEQPAMAAWLRAVADAFGKPDAIHITFEDGTESTHGHFSGTQTQNALAPKKKEKTNQFLKPLEQPESAVLMAVQRYLAAHPAVARVIRINSGAAWLGKCEDKQFVRFCEIYGQAGIRRAAARNPALRAAAEELTECVPDVIGLLRDGRFLAIEVKRSGWTKPTCDRERAQQRFLDAVRSAGGTSGFVTSIQDLEELLHAIP